MKINNTNIKLEDILEISKVLSPNHEIVSDNYYFIITLKTGEYYSSKEYGTYLECEKEIIKLENKIKINRIFKKIIKSLLLTITQLPLVILLSIIIFYIIFFMLSSVKMFIISFIIIIIILMIVYNYYNQNYE